jgi:hypothetical protein
VGTVPDLDGFESLQHFEKLKQAIALYQTF